jgi:exonuclease SbcC
MKYIADAEIEGYQGHEFTSLQFDKGFNVIFGRSHSGKSSIMRAIKWAFTNRPRGDGCRSDWLKDLESMCVSIIFSDGEWIFREKAKGLNLYRISGIEDDLDAIGVSIPDEVVELTGIYDENIQTQGEQYFLIDETPGKIAKRLNSAVGLEIIQEKASKAKALISGVKAEIKVLTAQLKTKSERLESKEFYGVDEQLKKAEMVRDSIKTKSLMEEKIKTILKIISQIDEYNEIAEKAKEAKLVDEKIKSIRLDVNRFDFLSNRVTTVQVILAEIESWEEEKKVVESISVAAEIAERIRGDIDELDLLNGKLYSIQSLCDIICNQEKEIKSAERNLSLLIKKRDKIESKIERCSKCGAAKQHWKKEA